MAASGGASASKFFLPVLPHSGYKIFDLSILDDFDVSGAAAAQTCFGQVIRKR